MAQFLDFVEVWRGSYLECSHLGHAVICDNKGEILAEWGDSAQIILPRSSCKILQALPLLESGAAAKHGLSERQLALSCASHQGAHMHADAVRDWLGAIDLSVDDLRCGPQPASDKPTREDMIRNNEAPCQCHNNCSGKHAGFLTLNKHLGGDSEYISPQHVVQLAVKDAFEDLCGETVDGWAIDGCSAPNFAVSLRGLASAMARIANPPQALGSTRRTSVKTLAKAMATYPEMVAGEGRACTELMQAMNNGTVVKTGAEGVFTAIVPSRGLGVALKIRDGATRASECAMAAILVRLGVADPRHPLVQKRLRPDQTNRRDIVTGYIAPSERLFADGAAL